MQRSDLYLENISAPAIQVATKVSRWDNYGIKIKNGSIYIVGYSNNNDYQDMCSEELFSSNDILFDMLILYKDMSEAKHYQLEHINDNLTDKDIKLLCEFCYKYGLPFCSSQRVSLDKAFGNHRHIVGAVPKLCNICECPADCFVNALKYLFLDFIKVVVKNNWEDDFDVMMNHISPTNLKKIKRNLDKHGLDLYTPTFNYFSVMWNANSHGLITYTENVLHLSSYYLCLLAESKTGYVGKIKRCEKCGKLFTANRSNMKYCKNPCTPQSKYSEKKRHKNKA